MRGKIEEGRGGGRWRRRFVFVVSVVSYTLRVFRGGYTDSAYRRIVL